MIVAPGAARDEAVWLWWGKKETERRRARKNVTGRSCGAVVQQAFASLLSNTALTETVQFLLDAAAAVAICCLIATRSESRYMQPRLLLRDSFTNGGPDTVLI